MAKESRPREEERRSRNGGDPPWRAAVRRRVHANALLSRSFLIINFLATVVASYGLLSNSTAVVIGAMLIATLLGPISGIALALVDSDQLLLRRALLAEIGGALLVVSVACGIGFLHRNVPLSAEILSRTHPNLLDLMIALAGGAAGGFATINRRLSQGLVGTAIATALVPPLASCGICLAHGRPGLAFGAFLLFFANLVAIQFASSVVLWAAGFHRLLEMRQHRGAALMRNGISVAALLTLGAVFAINFGESIATQAYLANVRERLERSLKRFPGVELTDVTVDSDAGSGVIFAVIRTPYSFSPDKVAELESELPKRGGVTQELHLRSVLVKETTRYGYMHEHTQPSP